MSNLDNLGELFKETPTEVIAHLIREQWEDEPFCDYIMFACQVLGHSEEEMLSILDSVNLSKKLQSIVKRAKKTSQDSLMKY